MTSCFRIKGSRLFNSVLYSHSCIETAEVLHLSSEDEVAELRERQEDDEEHDGETCQILGATSEGGRKLSHRLVEADVLKHL